MPAATIYDVARVAGVSHQTVSRWLRGSDQVRVETGERVRSAVEELGYKPNTAARFLRLGRTNRIGVLAHRLDLSGPVRLLSGATEAARESGYVLDIVAVDGNDLDDVETGIDLILEQQIAGVITVAQSDLMHDALVRRSTGLPMVDQVLLEGDTPLNEAAGRVAANHLVELGHTRLGYVSGPLGWPSAGQRARGFTDQARARGATVIRRAEGDWTARSGSELAARMVSGPERPTAIGTGNDSTAIGLVAGLARLGLSVPHDVSVIGTDDSADSAYLMPSLSTVQVRQEEEGGRLVRSLLALLDGDEETPTLRSMTSPALVPRESTRPR